MHLKKIRGKKNEAKDYMKVWTQVDKWEHSRQFSAESICQLLGAYTQSFLFCFLKMGYIWLANFFWHSYVLFFFLHFIYLFIYLWLCWVFVSVRGLSLVAAGGGHSSSWCAGPSPSQPLLLRSTGSRCAGSVIVAHGPSCSTACGIFPDQGLNPCPLHWQADSQPLRHQGSPHPEF